MSIDNRARDLALGIASALVHQDDVEPVKLATVTYLMESPDAEERAVRLVSYINATAVLSATVMQLLTHWYNRGVMDGTLIAAHEGEIEPEPPSLDSVLERLAAALPGDDEDEQPRP